MPHGRWLHQVFAQVVLARGLRRLRRDRSRRVIERAGIIALSIVPERLLVEQPHAGVADPLRVEDQLRPAAGAAGDEPEPDPRQRGDLCAAERGGEGGASEGGRGPAERRDPQVAAGEAADRRFYVAAMAGNLTDLAGPREALREGHVIEAIEKLAGADLFDFTHAMRFRSGMANEEGIATAAAMFVGTQEDAEFEFAFINPDNSLELASAGISALISDWREANGVTTLKTRQITLEDSKGYDLRLTLDGEPTRLPSGTQFSRIAKAGRAISAGYE